jgi:hypothetical protein
MSKWFYCPDFWELNSIPQGPIELDELVSMIKEGDLGSEIMVSLDDEAWREADTFAEIMAKCPPNLDELAKLYIEGCKSENWPEELRWVREKMQRWTDHLPQLAVDWIVRIVEVEPLSELLEQIGAGPLEDILDSHGEDIIERIEKEASRSFHFRYCLAGVWRRRISQNVWDKMTLALGTQVRY